MNLIAFTLESQFLYHAIKNFLNHFILFLHKSFFQGVYLYYKWAALHM